MFLCLTALYMMLKNKIFGWGLDYKNNWEDDHGKFI